MIYMLHISDLHFVKNAANYNTQVILRQEAKKKVEDIPKGQKLLIVTGDFHNFSDGNYKDAVDFLKHLVNDMGLDMSEDVFVIPGNHDVGNLDAMKACEDYDLRQENAVAAIRQWTANKNLRRYLKWRMEAFRPYCRFVRNLGIYDASSDESYPAQTHVRSWRGKLNILHLNTALVADGNAKADQMTDKDAAADPDTWKAFDPEHMPAIAIAHNSYFDLQKEQRDELAETFLYRNVSAYLCGDRHRTEQDAEQQMIRLKSGHRMVEEIPNLVAAKAIADSGDNYSEVGFCWHEWDEETDHVSVAFWEKDNRRLVKRVSDGEPDEYVMRRPQIAEHDSEPEQSAEPKAETLPVSKDPDADLKSYLNELLIRVRDGHPSFKLMKIDDLDRRLFPGIQEIQRFTLQGSLKTNKKTVEKVSPVWEWIEDSWKSTENHSVVIEGEGGIGKTVTLFSVTEQADGYPKVPALYIPVFDLVEDGKSLTMTAYLQKRIPEKANAICELAARPWRGPSILLLLDGFNEIPAANRYEVLQLLKQWRVDHPGAQMIAVSRPLSGINLSQSLGEGTLSIQLTSLEKADVQAYVQERFPGRPLPPDYDEIWKYLVNSLFLTLYLKTGILDGKEASGYPLMPKHANGRGGIIWNFLQRELLRHTNEAWVIRCAIACEYILPRIAYEMVSQFQFTMEKTALYRIVQEIYESLQALKPLSPLTLPAHLKLVFEAYEEKHPLQYPNIELPELVDAVIHETGLLAEYQKDRKKGEKKRYAFIHQHFRDCLAGIQLVNQTEMAGKDELPDVWRHGQNPLALDYTAELMDTDIMDKLWETNRQKQQYDAPGYEKNHTVTYALLELQKRRRPLPKALNFSGMDLRGLNLTRYMGLGGMDLGLFRDPNLTDKTQFDLRTFQSEGHRDSITCMAILPDGRVVSGSNDNTLRVWDTITAQCLQVLEGHLAEINCIAVLSEDQVVSGSNDETLRVWDASTGQCLQVLEGHLSGINCVAVLPDGRVVSGSADTTLRVWNADTGQCIQTLDRHTSGVINVAVLPEGRVVSTSWDGTLQVWNVDTGICFRTLKMHSSWFHYNITCLAVLTNGLIASGWDDNTLRVWNVTTGRCQIFKGHKNRIICVAGLRDSLVVSGSKDSTLRVWDTATGLCRNTLRGHTDDINCIAVFPDGRVISGSDDCTLRVWDSTTGFCLQTLKKHKASINCVAPLPYDRVVSCSNDRTLRVWEATTNQCLQILNINRNYPWSITCVAVFPDDRVVSGSDDSMLRVWDAKTGRCLKTLIGHKNRINCVAVLPDGHIVSCSNDNTLRVWDVQTGKNIKTLTGHKEIINCVAALPNGRVVSGSDDLTLRVWDVATGECLQILEGYTREVRCVTVFKDGRIVSGSYDHTLLVWNADKGTCIQRLKGHEDWITCVAVIDDDRVVSGSFDEELRIWNVKTGQCLQIYKGHTDWISSVGVFKDGLVISCSSSVMHAIDLQVWDATSGQCLCTFGGDRVLEEDEDIEKNAVPCVADISDRRKESDLGDPCVAILQDGRVVSGLGDNTLRVWNPEEGDRWDVLETTEVDVSQMDFSKAFLENELSGLLWKNCATISPADCEHWLNPR